MNALVPIAVPTFDMADIKQIALAIANGGLFGSTDPNAVLTLCLLAQAEGQHPAVVFRDYHIIKGKPAKKADAMLRDFVSAGGKVEWHELTDEKADATFSHPYGGTIRIDWTMQRARTAQLTTDMWRKYPRQMLRSRVISEGVRTVYPGATSGLYEVGEVEDIVADTRDGGVIEHQGHSHDGAVSPDVHHDDTAATPTKRVNWGGRYPTKTAMRAARVVHHAELERMALESTLDDLDGYLTSPEYVDYITTATEHFPDWLEGELPDGAPPEYVHTFRHEQRARDMIAIRGNVAMEQEPVDG